MVGDVRKTPELRSLALAVALLAAALLACRSGSSTTRPDASGVATPATAPTPIAASADAGPPFAYSVRVTDRTGALATEHAALKSCVESGLDQWGQFLTGKGVLEVEIIVEHATAGRLTAASATGLVVGACTTVPGPCGLAEDQAIHRLKTGDANPDAPGKPDVQVHVTPEFWRDALWMDPDPKARTAPVPLDRDDAISVCTHELGHGFGMAGYRDVGTYAAKPQAGVGMTLSRYDELIDFKGLPTFVGPKTIAEFGPVPLAHDHTTQDLYHYGTPSTPTPYDDKLMNGVHFYMGQRYFISRGDVLIVSDLGAPVRALPSR